MNQVVRVRSQGTVSNLKTAISARCRYTTDEFYLRHGPNPLEDECTIEDYNIECGSTIIRKFFI